MTRRFLVAIAVMTVASIPGAAQRAAQGTAEISGTVTMTTGAPPTPLARVLVTISGESLKPSRTAITDDQGRYALRDLPPGKITIVAARPPYVKTAFGAKRPGRPGTPIELAAGQIVSNVTIRLARGAAITGLVRHPDGEVAPGITIVAVPLDKQDGSPGATAATDDRGVYRLFGLAPGNYIVKASPSERVTAGATQVSDAQMDEILAALQRRFRGAGSGFTAPAQPPGARSSVEVPARGAMYSSAPVYYPGTPDPDQAETFSLAEGEERVAADMELQLVRASTIQGRITNAGGALPASTQVTLTRAGLRGRATRSVIPDATARPDASGAFRFTAVVAGQYRMLARAMWPGGVSWAATDITVGDDDLAAVALTLQPGLKLTGRVAFDARTLTRPQNVQLRLTEPGRPSGFARSGVARADGAFEISGLIPGVYTVTSPLSESGWWLRSFVIDGRDMLDFPLEIGRNGDVSGAVATFTDRRTELSGTLQGAPNVPASDYVVVVFAADRTFWTPGSRRVRLTPPGLDGRFTFRDLPPGDYLLAAVADVEAADLADVSFLERVIPAALKVRVDEGGTTRQDLRLVK